MDNSCEIFSKIYDQHINKIYRFVFLKVNSQEIAEDLTSEIFLRCWKTFKEDQDRIENVQAFLYQVARNLVTDYYREKGRTRIVPADCVPIIDPNSNIEEKALLGSDLNKVKLALNNLKEQYQELIIWHYIDDLTIPEIAKLAGKKENTIRVGLHRALKALKNELENKFQSA